MERLVHFARLERPTDPFRVACGCWRARGNWAPDAALVTCPECLQQLGATVLGGGRPQDPERRRA